MQAFASALKRLLKVLEFEQVSAERNVLKR